MLEHLFNKVIAIQACYFIKKRLQHRCFLVEFAKILRTPTVKKIYKWLLLLDINRQTKSVFFFFWSSSKKKKHFLKGTVRQIEKALITDRLPVSKESWKFHIPTIYNFAVTDPWNLLFFKKQPTFLTVSIVFFC